MLNSHTLISNETDDTEGDPLDKINSNVNYSPRKVIHAGKQGQKHKSGVNECTAKNCIIRANGRTKIEIAMKHQ